jgi:hypothetical protein
LNRAEQVGLTRLFRNRKVTVQEIVATAAGRTNEACTGRHVLIIEDTSEINYQSKAGRKRDLGRVGNAKDVGLFLHPAVAVDGGDGSMLGVAAATIWRRTKSKDVDYQDLPLEAKESHRWVSTAQQAQAALSQASMTTTIADREADIYEAFARVPCAPSPGAGHHLIIRATARFRRVIEPEKQLLRRIAAHPEAGRLSFDMPARQGRAARRVELAVRFGRATLRKPHRGGDPRDPAGVLVNFIDVCEVAPPAGEKPVHWRLLTTHPVESLEQAAQIVEWYRMRWDIEQVFRTLKSQAVDVEDSLIADGPALERLVAACLLAAVKVMQMVNGRGEAGQTIAAARLFPKGQIEVLHHLNVKMQGKTQKQKNPHPVETLAWAAWVVARLGGWMGYASERKPGPITFTNGLKRFEANAEGYLLSRYGA